MNIFVAGLPYDLDDAELEEIFENREQIEISKYYERLPKPTLIAVQEYTENKIYYRNPTSEINDIV